MRQKRSYLPKVAGGELRLQVFGSTNLILSYVDEHVLPRSY